MRAACPSPQLPSWQRPIETLACTNGTPYIQIMAWHSTKATLLQSTLLLYGNGDPPLYTVSLFLPFGRRVAGPRGRYKQTCRWKSGPQPPEARPKNLSPYFRPQRIVSVTGITACSQPAPVSLTHSSAKRSVKSTVAVVSAPATRQERVADGCNSKAVPVRAWPITRAKTSKRRRNC